MTTAYPFGTVSLEVHRGPITKGCGMTEKPVTTGVFDTLPERADMPRIMDERTNATVVWSPERGWHDGERVQVRNVGGRLDTRTRAQLDDGCVTGCSCNGSQS